MVESVSSVNAATKSAQVSKVAEDKDEAKKLEEQKAKKTDKKETKPVEEEKTHTVPMDKYKVESLVRQYIENLKKEHDYPMVQDRLQTWMDLFNIDKFMKKYPEIYVEADLKLVMYNETINLL